MKKDRKNECHQSYDVFDIFDDESILSVIVFSSEKQNYAVFQKK